MGLGGFGYPRRTLCEESTNAGRLHPAIFYHMENVPFWKYLHLQSITLYLTKTLQMIHWNTLLNSTIIIYFNLYDESVFNILDFLEQWRCQVTQI